ncbi:MAG: hypothetical protein QM733_07630 [Ilumatobacteraceae bacterium]
MSSSKAMRARPTRSTRRDSASAAGPVGDHSPVAGGNHVADTSSSCKPLPIPTSNNVARAAPPSSLPTSTVGSPTLPCTTPRRWA